VALCDAAGVQSSEYQPRHYYCRLAGKEHYNLKHTIKKFDYVTGVYSVVCGAAIDDRLEKKLVSLDVAHEKSVNLSVFLPNVQLADS